jgi:hypothetical protein
MNPCNSMAHMEIGRHLTKNYTNLEHKSCTNVIIVEGKKEFKKNKLAQAVELL